MSIDWDDYNKAEWSWITKILQPPTRAETILHAWENGGRQQWPIVATPYGMTIEHDLDIIEPMRFEQFRYGDVIAIECEGVIVERTPIAR